jgi:hypothetical protein
MAMAFIVFPRALTATLMRADKRLEWLAQPPARSPPNPLLRGSDGDEVVQQEQRLDALHGEELLRQRGICRIVDIAIALAVTLGPHAVQRKLHAVRVGGWFLAYGKGLRHPSILTMIYSYWPITAVLYAYIHDGNDGNLSGQLYLIGPEKTTPLGSHRDG